MLKLLLAMCCVLVVACSETSAPPLRIGTNLWPGFEPLYLARELGYLDKHKIRLVEYTSTSQVIKAYRSGLLDAAAVTLDVAISMQASGEHMQIVLVLDVSDGADVLLGQPELKSIQDIAGKRVGIEHSALGTYFIHRTLEVSGIDKASVTIVPYEPHNHERVFNAKEVDALVTFDPVRSRLLANGAVLLFDSQQLPGEIVDVLIVRKDIVKSAAEHIEHLKEAWFKAIDRFKNNPQNFTDILNKRMKLGEENVLTAFQGMTFPGRLQNQSLLNNNEKNNLQKTSREMATSMYESQIISVPVDTQQLFRKSN